MKIEKVTQRIEAGQYQYLEVEYSGIDTQEQLLKLARDTKEMQKKLREDKPSVVKDTFPY